MKHKIRKIVTAALLSMAVLGMSVPALSASAATESVNGCEHSNTQTLSINRTYINASPQEHQVKVVENFYCYDCRKELEKTTVFPEAHMQVSGTLYCVCGYYLH